MSYGYIVVEMNITDTEQYKHYMADAPASVKAFGGEYLVRGGRNETLEGDCQPHHVAMLRFPSFEQTQAFYQDAQYQQTRKKRVGVAAYFNMALV
jgi:uncharacterized protein (DUF1330 family)